MVEGGQGGDALGGIELEALVEEVVDGVRVAPTRVGVERLAKAAPVDAAPGLEHRLGRRSGTVVRLVEAPLYFGVPAYTSPAGGAVSGLIASEKSIRKISRTNGKAGTQERVAAKDAPDLVQRAQVVHGQEERVAFREEAEQDDARRPHIDRCGIKTKNEKQNEKTREFWVGLGRGVRCGRGDSDEGIRTRGLGRGD